jgi:uncharacterized protein YndB with AHSA1/START domain
VTGGTKQETQVVADPDVPLVRITREFDAPPEKVYRAHVDRDLAAQWMGPPGVEMVVDVWDARTGGSYRYLAVDGGEEYGFRGCFHELRPGELIVQTMTFEGMPDDVTLETYRFEDLGLGRTRLTATSLCASFADRDGLLASGVVDGTAAGFDKLDDLLART